MHPVPLRRALLVVAALAIAAMSACGRLSAAPPAVVAACRTLPPPDPAVNRRIEPRGVDQWLISEAILHAVNLQRCDHGRAPLADDPALDRAAAAHSGDMATRGYFAHESPAPGRRTPDQRLARAGARFTRVAENIAQTSLYAFRGGKFYIRDRARCLFSLTPNGPPVLRRTYAGAAKQVVANWMNSPEHRRNILDPRLTRHGAGAAVRRDPRTCGDLLVTEDFAG